MGKNEALAESPRKTNGSVLGTYSVGDGELYETFLKNNRFHVRLRFPNGKTKTMPRYIYKWLLTNPDFLEVPKGYSIHHLDCDQTNDDPSNLCLMHRYHHTAYHLKHLTAEVVIKYERTEVSEYSPIKKPRFYYNEKSKRYWIYFREKKPDGSTEAIQVWRHKDMPILDQESAEKAIEEIWESALKGRE